MSLVLLLTSPRPRQKMLDELQGEAITVCQRRQGCPGNEDGQEGVVAGVAITVEAEDGLVSEADGTTGTPEAA